MEESAQDVVNKFHGKRLDTLEVTSANLLVAVEKQSLIIGMMAKVMVGGGAVLGTAVCGALAKLIFKV